MFKSPPADVAMLNVTLPRRSPIKITYFSYVLDGGTIVRRFVSFRPSRAAHKARHYLRVLREGHC